LYTITYLQHFILFDSAAYVQLLNSYFKWQDGSNRLNVALIHQNSQCT